MIVTIACGSTIVPLLSFDRFRKNVSSGSATSSEMIVDVDGLQPLVRRERQRAGGRDVVVPRVRGPVRGGVVDRDRVVHLAAEAHRDVDDVVPSSVTRSSRRS